MLMLSPNIDDMGEMPDYVRPIQTAKYYGISPLEVMNWPRWLIEATSNVIEAERNAQATLQRREEAKAKRKGGK